MRAFGRVTACMVAAMALGATACTKEKGVQESVSGAADVKAEAATPAAPVVAGTPGQPAVAAVSESCQVVPGIEEGKPAYLAGRGVVLTRMLKGCVTKDGRKGFEKGSPYLAMGFPCTGGSGKIDIKGHYGNPKMVAFVVATDCAMSAGSKDAVQKAFVDTMKLPSDSPLMAVNPFAVQYWEVPGMPDADAGFAVELRSAPGIEGGWKRVRDHEPLRVRLFGRENAWVRGEHFYAVDADIELSGQNSFVMKIVTVKSLTPDEVGALKQRCTALRPQRNCGAIM